MRTAPLLDDHGKKFGFRIGNLWTSRSGITRIVSSIPGATITKSHKPWRGGRSDDDFCHFTVNGHQFVVWEPWGDSDSYWVYPREPSGRGELQRVEEAFTQRGFIGT